MNRTSPSLPSAYWFSVTGKSAEMIQSLIAQPPRKFSRHCLGWKTELALLCTYPAQLKTQSLSLERGPEYSWKAKSRDSGTERGPAVTAKATLRRSSGKASRPGG